ncbi:MAG: carbohydrate ABC transporter permease [Candidatus Acetothermia bacterium]
MKRKFGPFLFLLPSIGLLMAILLYPLGFSLFYSFQNWNLQISPIPQGFVGFTNYVMAFRDPHFLTSLTNTMFITFISTTLQLVLGMGIALLLNARLKGTSLVRTLIILPVTIAPLVVGFIFRYMLYSDGVLSFILRTLGFSLPEAGILGSGATAIWAIIFTDTWQWTPFFAIILLAGLQAIPTHILEAAKVDGASGLQVFWYIMLPHLKFVLSIVLMIRFMKTFNLFDIIHILTRGGPGAATRTLSYNLYYAGLRYFNVGYASALAWIMIAIVIVLINIYIAIAFKEKEL